MPTLRVLLLSLLGLALAWPGAAQDGGELTATAFARGREQMQQRNFEAATSTFGKLVAADPNQARFHQWYGRALGLSLQYAGLFKAMGSVGKIRTAFEKAVQLEPDNVEMREDLAGFYLGAPAIVGGGKDKARVQIEELRRRDPAKAALLDGELALAEKRWEDAAADFRRSAKLAPGRAEPFVRLSRLQQQQEKWPEAFASLDRALKLESRHAGALYVLGRAGALSGQQLDRAEAALRTFLTLRLDFDDPSPAAGHFRLGGLMEKRGNVPAARAEYEKALRLDPKFKEVRTARDRLK